MTRKEVTPSKVLAFMMLVAALPIAGAMATAQSQGSVIAEPPTLVPGDTWVIRYSDGATGTRKFLKEEAGLLVFAASHTWKDGETSQGLLHLTRDLATVRMLASDGTELRRFEPHSFGLRFPLEVGKEWQDRSQRFDQGKLVGTFLGTYKVVGAEEVGVPAGTFQSVRVEGQTYELRAPTRVWRFTHWYAPEVRMEVKLQAVEPNGSQTQFELVEFRPAGGTRPQ
ncbi:MAG: hypothetical protein ACHQ7N_20350 [Candidatus Methylomirabilales bacterium]